MKHHRSMSRLKTPAESSPWDGLGEGSLAYFDGHQAVLFRIIIRSLSLISADGRPFFTSNDHNLRDGIL